MAHTHIWMMHYCYSLLHERSRTRVQHKLQHQIQMCSDCISCSATYFDFWWRRLRFLLTEVWREKMKARRSRLLRLQGSSTVVCLEGQQTFCGSFDCLFVFRIPKISQERNSYALQPSAAPLMVATQIDHQKCRKNESNFWWWSWWRVVNYHANEIEEGLIDSSTVLVAGAANN